MIELFGFPLGTIFQGGTLAAALAMLAIVGRAWIIGVPERMRVANEGKITAAAELAERYKAWRVEVHGLKNDLMVVAGKQEECNKALAEAHAVNRHNESQMSTMLFLIRLLIRELERLAPDSIIVQQAKITLEQLGHTPPDPGKSDALNVAEGAVRDAKQTLASTRETREEVRRTEGEDNQGEAAQ